MIHYILKDFQSMFKTQKFFMILMICVQVLSVVVIFFAYGVINHYNTQIGVTEGTAMSYTIQLTGEERMEYEEIQRYHKALLERYEYKLEDFVTASDINYEESDENYGWLMTSVKYIDGEYTVGSHRFRKTLNYLDRNAYISNEDRYIIEQFDKGENVAIVGERLANERESIEVCGKEYKIIGIFKDMHNIDIYIPHAHMSQEANYILIGITLAKPLLDTEYEELQQITESCFHGKATIYEKFIGVKNPNQYRVYKSIIAILSAFVVMSGMNYSAIFCHILDKRRRMLAVSRVCGCTSIKSVFIYVIEIMSVSIATLVGGVLIFIYGILPNIKNTFEYIEYYLNTEVYIRLILIYIAILVAIFVIPILKYAKKTPVKLIKGV